MSKRQFTTRPAGELSPITLKLKDTGGGIVELWCHIAINGYRIGHFECGMFVAKQLSQHAQDSLNLAITDSGHILTIQQSDSWGNKP